MGHVTVHGRTWGACPDGREPVQAVAPTSSPRPPTRRHRRFARSWDIEILVNNAGFRWGATELCARVLDAMFAPMSGAVLSSRISPGMVARDRSVTHQQHGRRLVSRAAAYGATKAPGVIHSVHGGEYSPQASGHAVAPGPIYTRPEARNSDSLGAATDDALRRPSESPSRGFWPRHVHYMTGAIGAVDGGRTAI